MASQPDNFLTVVPITLKEEGGFVNNPHDPGGATKYGVTKTTWEGWVGHPVTVEDIANLTIGQVLPLYRVRYWNATSCGKYPIGLALCVFDFAVNSGDGRAVMELQKLIGVVADGHAGDLTTGAVDKFLPAARSTLIINYQNRREAFDESLATFDEFGDGWTARCKRITQQALTLN